MSTEIRNTSHPRITFLQGTALIFGTNIGAGILSLPYATRNGGYLALAISLVVAGFITTISMLFVAEASLRTKEPLQLSGLAEKYLGQTGRWLTFISVTILGVAALTAYAAGSGTILHELLGIPPIAGTLIFFGIGTAVILKGLEATGLVEGILTSGMAIVVGILCIWTFIGPGIDLMNLWVLRPYFIVPVMNMVMFIFIGQFVVPELARGLEDRPWLLPRAVVAGMSAVGFTIALVSFTALGLLGMNVDEVVTVSWGQILGPVAYYMANIFALIAMLTSLVTIGYSSMRNITDLCHWREDGVHRIMAVAWAMLPPIVISIAGWGGIVSVMTYAGGFSGAIMSIMPVWLLRKARQQGDRKPGWVNTWQTSPIFTIPLVALFSLAFIYSALLTLDLVPAGWN
ncbi:amino acid permease [Corynebacterium poyangense]|uniref:Amino acid permease n=1 Tax=Corynebacterium poyangense TaxID=2684405 RepID=A0A7H0SL44_9CORY|nr:aromatic amino acid transport family protein [Corynebacterium poyangense]MBZ8177354.1 amino acid permease [Corynebacterium poyangense]QNQ89269.1 amino acid permease [Corynebacterium poyangense]